MTAGTDLGKAAVDVLLAYYGVSVTYTEAVSGTAQAVTALEENFSVDGHEASLEFKFESTDLTIANWRGATITSSDAKLYKVIEKSDTAGLVKFTGVRDLERS